MTADPAGQEVFEEVFQFVLGIAVAKKLISGKTVGVDSTMLEANAAMKTILRRDTFEDWKEYVTRLMHEEGVIEMEEEPSDEEVRRYDKARKNKKVSNEEWVSPTDPDSRIAQMKDGRTHLAYKAEHVVDLKSDVVLATEVLPADQGDTQTMVDSVMQAQVNLAEAGSEQQIEEVAAEQSGKLGDHSLQISISDKSLAARGDRELLATIVTQFVDNAAKYSTPGSSIKISAQESASDVLIAVHNQGPLIQPKDRERIFERFYRCPETKHRAPGTGIGLSIAKKAAEVHNGHVWVISDEQEGTTFFLSILGSKGEVIDRSYL